MDCREYDVARDRDAVIRIWTECGWLEDEGDHPAFDLFFESGRTIVADIDGVAECIAMTEAGTLRHLSADMPFSLVSAVTTSRIARKQGLAGRLTARAVAEAAEAGAPISGLGMFEQGFYNQLGYGSGSYAHVVEFDPAGLTLPAGVRARTPKRLTPDDAPAMHANRLRRLRRHGSCSFSDERVTKAEALWGKHGFGLGYYDEHDGRLTHHLWCTTQGKAESGPYRVRWLAFETYAQILELMAVIRSWGDQVRCVKIDEPSGIQLQDLIAAPTRTKFLTKGSDYAQQLWFMAWWQMRMCDVAACLQHTHLDGAPVRFNLELSDPIERFLPDDLTWRGVAGEYVVTLGPESSATGGRDDGLPTMRTTVNAFTRMWLGVRPPTGLAVTAPIDAPPALLEDLDRLLRLPQPQPEWDF